MNRRAFLAAALAEVATTPLTLAPRAFAAGLLDGAAERVSQGQLKVRWSGASPVTLYASSDPDAPAGLMRPLKAGAVGGAAEVDLQVSPRPYLLVQDQDGGTVRVAERLLPLKGGRNFRDLGGWRAADGRQVRWGRIYRSGVMVGLTPADIGYLSSLGLRVICDLRSRQERAAQPSPFTGSEAQEVVATDYDMFSMAEVMRAPNRAAAIAAFARNYVGLTDILAPQYTDLFARLVRRQTPLAFNCSAGKDRTGLGAALLLSVLGVPRERVLADYALTEVYTPAPAYLNAPIDPAHPPAGLTAQQAESLAHTPREAMQVLMGSNPEILRQALAMIDAKYGGPIELAKARYGLNDLAIGHLRETYLI